MPRPTTESESVALALAALLPPHHERLSREQVAEHMAPAVVEVMRNMAQEAHYSTWQDAFYRALRALHRTG